MTIESIMSRDVQTVAADTTLLEIQERLHEGGFHHLLVMEDRQLVGVISDRDVLRALSPFLNTLAETPRDVRTLSEPARKIMRADPVTAGPGMTVEAAARVLLDRVISCLPVVEEGEVVGIVTSRDVMRHYIVQ